MKEHRLVEDVKSGALSVFSRTDDHHPCRPCSAGATETAGV